MNKATYRDCVGPGEQVQSNKKQTKKQKQKDSEFTTKLSPEGETAALFGTLQEKERHETWAPVLR